MALKPQLSNRQTQRLALTPSMQQGVAILQMPTLDLGDELRRLADENPLIELTEPAPEGFDPEIARNLSPPQTLPEYMREQVTLMALPAEVAALAQLLTGDLDENGYLSASAKELALDLNLPEDLMDAAITALQACEPAGVAARNLPECLALQLTDKGVPAPMARAACAHLDLLMEERWAAAALRIGHSETELRRLAGLIRTLSPRPAATFAETAHPMIPEALVEVDEHGRPRVAAIKAALPSIMLDRALAAQTGTRGPLHTKLKEAKGLLQAMRFRGRTVLAIIRAITNHQARFFLSGPDHMVPLTRITIAQELGLHPATIGRALSGKALLFNGATYPLATFFPSAVGKNSSAYSVQRRLKQLVDTERGDSVLSDEEIATYLQQEGVDIARRTVAKYRKCLNIPSSFERKRIKSLGKACSTPKGLGSP